MSDMPTGTVSHNDPITDILLGLIAELRTAHHAAAYALTDGAYCPICQTRSRRDWPCDTASMTDRAEARLRELMTP